MLVHYRLILKNVFLFYKLGNLKINNQNENNNTLNKTIGKLQKQLEESIKINSELEVNYEELKMASDRSCKEKTTEISKINQSLSKIQKEKDSLEEKYNNLDKISINQTKKLEHDLIIKEDEIIKLKNDLQEKIKEIDDNNNTFIKTLSSEKNILNIVIDQLKGELSSYSNNLSANKREINSCNIKMTEYQERISVLKNKKKNCKRDFREFKEKLENSSRNFVYVSEENKNLKQKIQDLQLEYSNHNELLINFNSIQGRNAELENKIPHYKEKRKYYKTLYGKFKESLEKSDKIIEELRNDKNQLNETIRQLIKKETEINGNFRNLEDKIKILNDNETTLKFNFIQQQNDQSENFLKEKKELLNDFNQLNKELETLKLSNSELLNNFNNLTVKLKESQEIYNKTKDNELNSNIGINSLKRELEIIKNENVILNENIKKELLKKEEKIYDNSTYKIISNKILSKLGLKFFLLKKNTVDSVDGLKWVESSKIDENKFEKDINNDISVDKEMEIQNLKVLNNNLAEKLSKTSIKEDNNNSPSIPLEIYEKVINKLNEESTNYQNVIQALEVVKKENEFYKQLIDSKKEKNNNGNHANLSFIDQDNNMESKFIENQDEINDLFFESVPQRNNNDYNNNKNLNLEVIKIEQNNYSSNNIQQNNDLLNLRKNSVHDKKSIQSLKTRRTEESIKEQKDLVKGCIKENVYKLEENEKLFTEQVSSILFSYKISKKNSKKQETNVIITRNFMINLLQ